jgi:hypothetical protein
MVSRRVLRPVHFSLFCISSLSAFASPDRCCCCCFSLSPSSFLITRSIQTAAASRAQLFTIDDERKIRECRVCHLMYGTFSERLFFFFFSSPRSALFCYGNEPNDGIAPVEERVVNRRLYPRSILVRPPPISLFEDSIDDKNSNVDITDLHSGHRGPFRDCPLRILVRNPFMLSLDSE